MSACIYYDLERVGAEHVAAARARLPNAIEIFPSGTVRDPGVDAGESTPSARDPIFLAEFYEWFDRVVTHLRRFGDDEISGVSLLEVARYSIFYALAHDAQRWHALDDMLRRFAPKKILWVTEAGTQIPGATTSAAAEGGAMSPPGTVIAQYAVEEGGKSLPGVRRSLRTRLYPLSQDLRWLRARAEALVRGRARSAPLVFAEYFPNSALGLIPIAERLERDFGRTVLWLAGREQVVDALGQRGISSVLLTSLARAPRFYPLSFKRQALIRKLLAKIEALPDDFFDRASGAAGRRYILPTMRRVLSESLSESFFWTRAFEDAFSSLGPELVVSTTFASPYGRAAALTARRYGSDTAYVQHGVSPLKGYDTSVCQESMLVWGNAVKRSLSDGGVADDSVHVVGAAKLDDLAQRGALTSDPLPPPGRPLRIVYMASRTAGSFVSASAARLAFAAIAGACDLIPHAVLTVKLHPADHTGLIPQWLSDHPSVVLETSKSAQQLILDNDLVVVVSSTTGLEACVARRPLVCLRIPGLSVDDFYSDYGAVLDFSLEGEEVPERLAGEISRLRENVQAQDSLAEGRTRLLEDRMGGARGDAAKRAAAVLNSLLRDTGS